MPSDDGASIDSIFDSNIPFDDEEVSMLAMQIAMYIREYLITHKDDAEFLFNSKHNENDEIKNKIKKHVTNQFQEYLNGLGTSIEEKPESKNRTSGLNTDLILGVINKSLEEALKIVHDVGSQEGQKGIGWWNVGKTIKSSFTYYGRRFRGDSKNEAQKKQLKDWEEDYRVEKKVRKAIANETVYDKNAKIMRLKHWDRRILFKTQKITEKKAIVKQNAKKQILDIKHELED